MSDEPFDFEAAQAVAIAAAQARGRIPMPPRVRQRKRANAAATRERLKAKGAPRGEDVSMACGAAAGLVVQDVIKRIKDGRPPAAKDIVERIILGAIRGLEERGFDPVQSGKRVARFVRHGGRLRPKTWTPGGRASPALPPVTGGNQVAGDQGL